MRRARVLAVLMTSLVLAGCGGRSPSSLPSSSPLSSTSSTADLPPAWVQEEAMWQSLAAGEPHPQSCQWLLTRPARAAHIAGSATSYLHVFNSVGEVYVVVLHGDFTRQDGQTTEARSLYLVLNQSHGYLAHGFTDSSIDLSALGRVHTYVPQLPVHAGVWGHTMVEGGPIPGGPWLRSHVAVAVWKGNRVPASGQPLRQVRSDANGFFSLDLPPGVYTLTLITTNHVPSMPVTVTVKAGAPVAAALFEIVF